MTVEPRPPRRGDVAAIVSALDAFARSAEVEPETQGEVEGWFDVPSLDLARDARVAVGAGRIAGYGGVDNDGGEGTQFRADLRVDPKRRAPQRACWDGSGAQVHVV